MDSSIADYIMDKSKKESIDKFVGDTGILNLQINEDKILKRYIIGFDFDISIRIAKDTIFKEYFDLYKEYLNKYPVNRSLKLKLLLYLVSRKVTMIPNLATLDTIENDSDKVGYNIYYSDDISESLAINIRQDLSSNLVVLSDARGQEEVGIIEEEMSAIVDLLSKGLFRLIIENRYPKILEDILPEKIYRQQIEDRILMDEISVKYDGKLYKSIKLGDSYVIVDSVLNMVLDKEIAEAIYCKINLSKSMFV